MKNILFFLLTPLLLHSQQKKINTDYYSYNERYETYMKIYKDNLKESFYTKLYVSDKNISQEEFHQLFNKFLELLPLKKLSTSEKELLMKKIFRKELIYNINGLLPDLNQLYGLNRNFSFRVKKESENKFIITINNSVFKSDSKYFTIRI